MKVKTFSKFKGSQNPSGAWAPRASENSPFAICIVEDRTAWFEGTKAEAVCTKYLKKVKSSNWHDNLIMLSLMIITEIKVF